MKTFTATQAEIKQDWWHVSAEDLILGRLASRVALMLRGKHKAMYTPHLDCGDHIVITNVEKIKLTGNKLLDKIYYWHTGYAGGIKQRTAKQIMTSKHPERILYKAVERMISRNVLGRKQMTKLHLYVGPEHPHSAQQPKELDIASMNPKNKR